MMKIIRCLRFVMCFSLLSVAAVNARPHSVPGNKAEYLLRVRIQTVKTFDGDPKRRLVPMVNVLGVVEEVVKGAHRFFPGYRINAFYPAPGNPEPGWFHVGQSYIFALRSVKHYDPRVPTEALVIETDIDKGRSPRSCGMFRVVEEFVSDPGDFFGCGVRVPWAQFMQKVAEQKKK